MGTSNLGSVRTFAARLVSAGGYHAYRTHALPAGRRPMVALAAVTVLSFIGVGFLVGVYNPFSAAPANVAIGLGLLLLATWILAGTLAGYLVFIESGPGRPAAGAAYPEHDADVRVSGITDGFLNRTVRIRESRGSIKLADYADNSAAGEIVIDCDLVPTIRFDPGFVVTVRTGSVFPWDGPRPAVRLDFEETRLTLSFSDLATRDSWLRVFETSATRLG
ncbi:MAG TPA: hypothetical protein VIK06_05170 [Candidatus Limnocylindrales bacterium]